MVNRSFAQRVKSTLTNAGRRGDFFSAHESYSQCGEDRIIALIFYNLGVHRPTYLDLGANHPIFFSNTYLFYRHGCRGVCVEANPVLAQRFQQERKHDRCLNVGVAATNGELKLHVFDGAASGLSTLSSNWAERAERVAGHKIREQISVPVIGINELLKTEFGDRSPDLLTIDIEGLDETVLRALDYATYRPAVLCVETITAASEARKSDSLVEFLITKEYSVFADTWINTILVRNERFPKF